SPSLFLSERNKEFYRLLAKMLLPQKKLLFSVIKYNGTPLSYHFGFDYNSSLIWYKPSYSREYSKKSPGVLMIRYLINYALDNNRSELDFTIGDESFKKRFTNSERYNSTLIIYNKFTPYLVLKFKILVKHLLKSLFTKQF
ncbi:MAG: GNAT family N-acetyltransferase, partial [Gammaproteobacteria bacterium]|nr:GNAT family N-acetyltransferase [Gammaproteobacteria bacterium]